MIFELLYFPEAENEPSCKAELEEGRVYRNAAAGAAGTHEHRKCCSLYRDHALGLEAEAYPFAEIDLGTCVDSDGEEPLVDISILGGHQAGAQVKPDKRADFRVDPEVLGEPNMHVIDTQGNLFILDVVDGIQVGYFTLGVRPVVKQINIHDAADGETQHAPVLCIVPETDVAVITIHGTCEHISAEWRKFNSLCL